LFLLRCYNTHSSQLAEGCQRLVRQNFLSSAASSASSSDCDPGEPGCEKAAEDDGGGGSAAAVVVSVFLSLVLLATCGALYVTRKQLAEVQESGGGGAPGPARGQVEMMAVVQGTAVAVPPGGTAAYSQVGEPPTGEGEGERLV